MEDYSRDVFYYETDRMGIVHHSNYIRMMEEARIFFMRSVGMPYDEMEKEGIIIPVISVNIKYKYSLKYGDRVVISLKLLSYNGIKFKCGYEIKNGEGKLCAAAESEHCFLDKDMKLFNFKRHFPGYHDQFQNLLE